MGISDSQPKS